MNLFLRLDSRAGNPLWHRCLWSACLVDRQRLAVAQYQSVLLWMNAVLALALFIWVVALSVGLVAQLRRGKFGARLTARFALAFALIGVLPGALIYTLSVQFMSRFDRIVV